MVQSVHCYHRRKPHGRVSPFSFIPHFHNNADEKRTARNRAPPFLFVFLLSFFFFSSKFIVGNISLSLTGIERMLPFYFTNDRNFPRVIALVPRLTTAYTRIAASFIVFFTPRDSSFSNLSVHFAFIGSCALSIGW